MRRETNLGTETHRRRRTANGPGRWALALAIVGLLVLGGTALAQQTHHVEDGDSIQAAIDAAEDGDTILVEPATYEEALDIHTSVRLASASAFDKPTVSAATTEEPIVSITAEDVEVADFEVQADGPAGLVLTASGSGGLTGIHVAAPSTSLEDVEVQLPGGWCGPGQDLCPKPWITGVRAEAGVTIEDSQIETSVASPSDKAVLGSHGVNANTGDLVEIRSTTVSGFGLGIVNWAPGVIVDGSELVGNVRGVQIPTDNVAITDTRFVGQQIGVNVAGSSGSAPTDVTLEDNLLGPSNAIALQIEANNHDSEIDASSNWWGTGSCAAIETARILDEGTGNQVDVDPYYADPLTRIPVEDDPTC